MFYVLASICTVLVTNATSGTFASAPSCSQSSWCKNGGTCVVNINNISCICPTTFTGHQCEKDADECGVLSEPCKNGASCVNIHGGYTCSCPSDYTGVYCERKLGDCPKLESIPNGIVMTHNNKLAIYTCSAGFWMTDVSFRRCQNGVWSGKEPVCILSRHTRSCERPDDIRHGFFKGNTSFTFGSTVEYFCDDKYWLKGDAVLTCQSDGKWNPWKTPRCIKSTEWLTLACSTRNWYGSVCPEKKCRNPGSLKHGRRDGTLFMEGTQVRFSCKQGYELVGHSTLSCVRSCYYCTDVRWKPKKPYCRKIDLQRVAESLRKHFVDKLSWLTTDGLARSGLSTGAGGLDLVFVFDSSASVGETNFQKGISFAKTIIDEFGISTSPTGTRVAVVTFSSAAKVVFNLKSQAIKNKTDAIALLEKLDYIAGGTATSLALNKTIEEIVPETRNNSKKALFLITDGRSNDGGDPRLDAMILRDSCDFEIYAIGVTNSVDENELRSIASEPFKTHVFLLKEFKGLAKLRELITAKGTDYSECGIAGDTQLGNLDGRNFRIVGGREAKPGAWPWQAAIYVNGNFRCGGALIKENWVLTVAHCFFSDGKVKPGNISIQMGEHDRFKVEGSEQNIRAAKLFSYPSTSLDRRGEGLVLIKLQSLVKLSPFVRPVCLPEPTDVFYTTPGKWCLVAGWGSTQKVSPEELIGAPYPVLQQIRMKLTSQQNCRENATNAQAITNKVICAGDSKGEKDSCKGDNGSPLLIRRSDDSWAVIGLSSWGEGCATRGKYGVYTLVKTYTRWINRRINKDKKKVPSE